MSKIHRRTETCWWSIRSTSIYGGGLVGHFDSIEEAREKIDNDNARANELGYYGETFLIQHNELYRWYGEPTFSNKDGLLLKEELLTISVELYGDGVQEALVEEYEE